MAMPRATFPSVEGFGIFVGVVAWDLLADGHMELVRAVLIAGGCALAWFGLRCWREKSGNKHE